MKVLIKSTRNLTNYYVHAYETWKKALAGVEDVRCYGEGYPNFIGWEKTDEEVYKALDFTPDVELWCGGPGNKKPQYVNDQFILRSPNPKVPKLILLCDYWEIVRDLSISSWHNREIELSKMGVVGYFSFYAQAKDWMENVVSTKMNKFLLFPYVFDDAFKSHTLDKKWDVNNQGVSNHDYPLRQKIRKSLTEDGSIKTFVIEKDHHYKTLDANSDPLEKYFHGGDAVNNFAKLLNSCWITITDGYTMNCPSRAGWKLDGTDLFLAKYPQTLASNSVLFCPPIKGSCTDHIEDGVHYVAIDGSNYMKKIKYFLSNKEKLLEISENATIWAEKNCSKEAVGERLKRDLPGVIG
jgi:hypothetical protein